jgi:hypothetical protein
VNGYANLIAARVRKLANEQSTGILPMYGRGDGAIFFRDGQVIYAKSSRTPLPGPRATGPGVLGSLPAQAPPSRGEGPASAAGTRAARPTSRLSELLKLTDLIVDALTDLLSSESRYAKFRRADVLPVGQGRPMAVETLLAEVRRRHEVLRQLAPVITPDTTIGCESSISLPSAQVTPAQWALLGRAAEVTTPRLVAMQLGRSVFGTTIEAYRLAELGLLAVPGRPPAPADGQAAGQPGAMSFMRAVTGGKGSDTRGTGETPKSHYGIPPNALAGPASRVS